MNHVFVVNLNFFNKIVHVFKTGEGIDLNNYDYLVAPIAYNGTVTIGKEYAIDEVWQVKFNPETIQSGAITVEECD